MTHGHRRRARQALLAAAAAAVVTVVAAACTVPGLTPAPAAPAAPATDDVFASRPVAATADAAKDVCVYPYHRVSELAAFQAATGRTVHCVLVYNNASPDWANWERPWFLVHGDPDFNWAAWKRADPARRLVITQALIPSGLAPDWRTLGAGGAFEDHARALAANYVAAGLGDSVIRLSHEANGTWTLDGLGDDPGQYGLWKTFWARTVRAMRSVPGAHFRFDWTVNAGYRAIPFDQWYPGDDVVDIVGADVYDFWAGPGAPPADPTARWQAQYAQAGGLGEIARWARAHGKPVSIPEWGLSAVGRKGGAGDNVTFVHGIAAFVRTNAVAYQSYFESTTDVGMLLTDAPHGLTAYRRHFGAQGDSVG